MKTPRKKSPIAPKGCKNGKCTSESICREMSDCIGPACPFVPFKGTNVANMTGDGACRPTILQSPRPLPSASNRSGKHGAKRGVAELEALLQQCDLVLTMVPHRGRDDNYMRIFGEEFVTPLIRKLRQQSALGLSADGKEGSPK